MEIGLFFGSFNPIHVGHLIIASHVINFTECKKVWFVVSPQNPLKNTHTLLNGRSRLYLVRIAIEDDSNFKINDIEFQMPRPSYTIDTLSYLKENYPQHQFSIILGSDSLENLPKWKNYKELIEQNSFKIFERPGFPIMDSHKNFTILKNTPHLRISASFIRQLIKERKSIKYLVPDKVLDEIERAGYYRN
jgi:nicotinate-nucleotide adenylyltransferase